MQPIIIPVTPFEQNCALLVCRATGKAAIVDPGGDVEKILERVTRENAHIESILLTHGHIDHCGGVGELARTLGVPVIGPQREDAFWIDNLKQQSTFFGFPAVEAFIPDRWLEHGDFVRVGETELEVRHCPGHTPGHVVFLSPADQWLIVGDVLFRGSIGRTDFPRGDLSSLISSIHRHIFTLDDSIQVYPGHGPTTMIGEERRTNPYVADRRYG
jgi:hydroxyacylglutathione hydrolase